MSAVRIDVLGLLLEAAKFPLRRPVTAAACAGLALASALARNLVMRAVNGEPQGNLVDESWIGWLWYGVGLMWGAGLVSLIFRRLLAGPSPARLGLTEVRLFAALLVQFGPSIGLYLLYGWAIRRLPDDAHLGVRLGLGLAVVILCLTIWSRLMLIAPLTFLQGRLAIAAGWRLAAGSWRSLLFLSVLSLAAGFAAMLGWNLLVGLLLDLKIYDDRLVGLSLNDVVLSVLAAWQYLTLFVPAALVCRQLSGRVKDVSEVFE